MISRMAIVRRLPGGRRLAWAALSTAVVAVAFAVVLPRITNYGQVWRSVSGLSWEWIVALAAATVLNLATFPAPWVAALPGLAFGNAFGLSQASTALTLIVPGGAPIGMLASFAMLRSWGLEGAPVGLAVVLTGVWNQLSTFAFPVVALAMLAADGGGGRSLELVALVGIVSFAGCVAVIAAAVASPRLARSAGDAAARIAVFVRRLVGLAPPAWDGGSIVRFREEALGLLQRRWVALTLTTLANQLTGYLLLELSLRGVGLPRGDVSSVEVFAAWSVGRLLASIPITPGGIGFVELGLTGALVAFGGADGPVVAGVLVYRFLSIAPILALGGLAAATWESRHPERRRRRRGARAAS